MWKKRCLGGGTREIYRNVSLVERGKSIVLITWEPGTSNEIIEWQIWYKGSLFFFFLPLPSPFSPPVVNYAAKVIAKMESDLESPFKLGSKHKSFSQGRIL